MNIYMWSGPRNLSTALMRSFENREDTEVWDEPLYAYYLNETKKNHPMKDEIIKNRASRSAKMRFAIRNENNFFYPDLLVNDFRDYLSLEGLRL